MDEWVLVSEADIAKCMRDVLAQEHVVRGARVATGCGARLLMLGLGRSLSKAQQRALWLLCCNTPVAMRQTMWLLACASHLAGLRCLPLTRCQPRSMCGGNVSSATMAAQLSHSSRQE